MDLPQHDEAAGCPRIDLQVPGSEQFLEVIRTVVGRAARLVGFTYDGIEDFSLAVDEAAVLLLSATPAELNLAVEEVRAGAGRLTAELAIDSGEWPPPDIEGDTRWHILQALCEEVWILDGDRKGIGLAQSVR